MKHLILENIAEAIATLQRVMADERLLNEVARAAEVTGKAMASGRKLMVAGNGGSAADSQHLVAEFVSRLTVDRPAMRAVALTTDTSILTAVGNDYSYDKVFERQIEALGQEGDVFFGISTSGNSPNVLRALELSRKMGITTIGFSGRQRRQDAPPVRLQHHYSLRHHRAYPRSASRPGAYLLHAGRAGVFRSRVFRWQADGSGVSLNHRAGRRFEGGSWGKPCQAAVRRIASCRSMETFNPRSRFALSTQGTYWERAAPTTGGRATWISSGVCRAVSTALAKSRMLRA